MGTEQHLNRSKRNWTHCAVHINQYLYKIKEKETNILKLKAPIFWVLETLQAIGNFTSNF